MLIIHTRKKSLWKTIWYYRYIYILIIPAIVWYFIFCYIPIYGITLAFREFRFDKGIWGSPWVGTRYLMQFFTSFDFWKIIWNTVFISSLKIILGFPAPIILALMLNEVRNVAFKKTIQTVSYLPYFVSWVVVITLVTKFLTPYGGLINEIKVALFGGEPIFFMGERAYFYPLVVLTDIWKNAGWGSIIYLAALTGINPELYEAAIIDGAGKWKSLIHITLPCLRPTMGIIFILSIGNLMRAGFDQIYLMQNPAIIDISEILDTHVLKMGIRQGKFSYASAVGLFQSVISFILIVIANRISRKTTEISLW